MSDSNAADHELLPQAKPSVKRIGIVVRPASGRQLLQFLGIASSKHDLIGMEGGDQAGDSVRNIVSADSFCRAASALSIRCSLRHCSLERQMGEFHRNHEAFDDEGGVSVLIPETIR